MSVHQPLHQHHHSLSIPSPSKGHRHRRSAAVSLDWRHVKLPLPTAVTVSASGSQASSNPSSHVSSISDFAQVAKPEESVTSETDMKKKRRTVKFNDEVKHIPAREPGDTWLKPEDYPFFSSSPKANTIGQNFIDLSPAALPVIPGSPSLLRSASKRSSFLPIRKNLSFLSRRPSKKRPISPFSNAKLELPAPKPLIDLDLALGTPIISGPQTPPATPPMSSGPLDSAIDHFDLVHRKMGSFSSLRCSPVKSHKRAESAPADFLFSFAPYTSDGTAASRKRKMSSVAEHPVTLAQPLEFLEVRMDILAEGIESFGEPGPMLHTPQATPDSAMDISSPTIGANAMPGFASNGIGRLSSTTSMPDVTTRKRGGWKGILHRLLH